MKLSIAQKLVAAFLGLTLLVLAATLILARWSFEQGFLDYVNAVEQNRLEYLQADLAGEYLSAGRTWQHLTQRRFAAVVMRLSPQDSHRAPPPMGAAPRGMALPPPGSSREPGLPPMGGKVRPRKPGGAFPPIGLYDVNGDLVAGATLVQEDSLVISVPIVVDDIVVGELRSEPRRRLTSPTETKFSSQQLRTSWMLGIVSLILALAISGMLARGLLAPVRRMIGSVARLSSGDYSHRMNESRSDELGQLTRDIDRLGATLEENQSSRKRLLADVSHELRTPLTVLSGEIEALKDGLRQFDREQLDSLDQEVGRLRHLVDDLYELSISDMGGLSYQFATMELTECLQKTVDSMYSRAADSGIKLSFLKQDVAGVIVEADARRIDQLLQNVLENSLAYTDAPGSVTVTLLRTEKTAIIKIEDTPPGVDESDYDKLFDPLFRQDTSRSRRTGGAGLGLAICRNIITAHGGVVSAMRSELGGLCVQIELPLKGESSQ